MKPIDMHLCSLLFLMICICSLLVLWQDTYGQWWDALLWCYWFTNHLGLLAAVEIAGPFVLCSYISCCRIVLDHWGTTPDTYYTSAGMCGQATGVLVRKPVCWSAGGVATSGKQFCFRFMWMFWTSSSSSNSCLFLNILLTVYEICTDRSGRIRHNQANWTRHTLY